MIFYRIPEEGSLGVVEKAYFDMLKKPEFVHLFSKCPHNMGRIRGGVAAFLTNLCDDSNTEYDFSYVHAAHSQINAS